MAPPLSGKYTPWTHLRRLRLDAGMTRPELANRVGCSYEQLCRIEQGRGSPSDRLVMRLAKIFGELPSVLHSTSPPVPVPAREAAELAS